MEGGGEGIAGCVMHVDMHRECVMLWVDAQQEQRKCLHAHCNPTTAKLVAL